MSISENLQKLDEQATSVVNALGDIKEALTAKEVEVPEQTKLGGVPALIGSIKNGSTVELVITAPDYEGQTLTATKDLKTVKGQVTEGTCRIPVDEEGIWTVSADDGNSTTIKTDMTFEGSLSISKTFGVEISTESDPEKRVTYIDEAIGMTPVKVDQANGKANWNGWDQEWIGKKIYPVMLKSDGTEDYRLDPEDVTQKLEGGASDVGNINYDGNAMVCYEKFYTKYSMNGSKNVIEICDKKEEGFEAIGFTREDGTEADKVYLPMYGGNRDSSGKLRSISGQPITYNISWNDSRTAAQKNGSGYDIETWAMNQMRQNVWYILMKNCNPKTAIAAGRVYTSAQTGVTNKVGAIGFDTSSKAVRFMWSEDFTSDYGNGIYFWEAGALCQSSKLYIKMKPPYSGTSISGYTQVGDYVHGTNYMSAMKCHNDFGRYGVQYNGSDSTYEVAYWQTSTGSSVYVSRRGARYGVAGRNLGNSAPYTTDALGASLSFLPPA